MELSTQAEEKELTMPILPSDNVTMYLRDYQRVSDTLNTIQASIDELSDCTSIVTHDAVAMVGELDDILATVRTLRDSIAARSIRAVMTG
jgi:hypothetical protein